MNDHKWLYQVQEGHKWGHGRAEVRGGAVVELTEAEAGSFVPWKLKPYVPETQAEYNPETGKLVFGDGQIVVDTHEGQVSIRDVEFEPRDVQTLEGVLDIPETEENVTTGQETGSEDVPLTWDPDLDDRIIDSLQEAGVFPEDLATKTDEELRAVNGIGPTSVVKIRKLYPRG